MAKQPLKWSDFPVWLRVLVVVAVINFLSFVAIAQAHGGDALNGYKRDGKYFVCQHGGCTEVSRNFWWYSYCHAIGMWITQITVVFVGGGYFLSLRSKRLTNR